MPLAASEFMANDICLPGPQNEVDCQLIVGPVAPLRRIVGSSAQGASVLFLADDFEAELAEVRVSMDEVGVFDRALSAEQVNDLATVASPFPVEVQALVDGVAVPCTSSESCFFQASLAFESTPVLTRVYNATGYAPTIHAGEGVMVSGIGFASSHGIAASVGVSSCSVDSDSINESGFSCDTASDSVGRNAVSALVPGVGAAEAWNSQYQADESENLMVTARPTVTAVSPSALSLEGGARVTIDGIGFAASGVGRNSVRIGTVDCVVVSATVNRIVCDVPESTTSIQDVAVVSVSWYPGSGSTGALTAQSDCDASMSDVVGECTSSLTMAATPSFGSVSPSIGRAGDSMTLEVTGLADDAQVTVTFASHDENSEDAACIVQSVNGSTITCTIGEGFGPRFVKVSTASGLARGSAQFEYAVAMDSAVPASGSLGGAAAAAGLTVTGSGFRGSRSGGDRLYIGSEECLVDADASSASSLRCSPEATF